MNLKKSLRYDIEIITKCGIKVLATVSRFIKDEVNSRRLV